MHKDVTARIVLIIAVVLALPAASQEAYEGFDYPAGESIVGQTGGSGWSGGWLDPNDAAGMRTASEGLTFLGLASTGGAVQVQSPTECDTARLFGSSIGVPGQTLFASMLLRLDAADGDRMCGFAVVTGDFAGLGAVVQAVHEEGQEQRRLVLFDYGGDGTQSVAFDPDVGTTYWLLGEAQIGSNGSATGVVSIWESGATVPTASVSHDLTGDWTNGFIALLAAGAGGVTFDEVRVGTTNPLAGPSAVPEAGTGLAFLVLAGVGGLGLVRTRLDRRR